MFKKILIANRGEIACRVIRTAKMMGIKTVAVYSDADADAPHVKMADEAVHIGPAPANQSYLVADKIFDAAKRTGAQAIHPGYGFLSENAEFSEQCDAQGIVFIGPAPQTIRAMGSKSAAKDLMQEAGVPVSPGYQGEDQSEDTFKREAETIGYPVLLKAVAGGGGKGMRLVEREADLVAALHAAQREAKSAFGDDRFLVEKYIERARHLEVQIFGDGKGNVVHMFERDCSVQRRHQKIIEEAPAPNLSDKVRANLLEAGVAAGKAVDYRGAGTVEFLYDGGDNVYFMEMNTRLQVEHPVSEEITGIDFVEWQLQIAFGNGLPDPVQRTVPNGHAFEARLYAEDPANDFAPSIGTLTSLNLPGQDDGVRLDSGVRQGQDITPHYDPMIAKLIVHSPEGADSRRTALRTMARALERTHVTGLETNTSFLHALASHPEFEAGHVSTRFIDDHRSQLFATPQLFQPAIAAWTLANAASSTPGDNDPWTSLTGWRVNRPKRTTHWIDLEDGPAAVIVGTTNHDDALTYHIAIERAASAAARRANQEGAGKDKQQQGGEKTETFQFQGTLKSDGSFDITLDGLSHRGFIATHLGGSRVFLNGHSIDILPAMPLAGEQGQAISEGSLIAPMPGTVTQLMSAAGDRVEAGDVLMVMEAMKMEHSIKAPHAGTIEAFHFAAGDQVREGDELAVLSED